MIVQCPSCKAKFRVADEKIKSQGVKVRCGRCKTIFRVRPAEASARQTSDMGSSGLRRTPAPTDHSSTRVVFDPVGEALEEVPSGMGNPLLRTGESPRGLGAALPGDTIDDLDATPFGDSGSPPVAETGSTPVAESGSTPVAAAGSPPVGKSRRDVPGFVATHHDDGPSEDDSEDPTVPEVARADGRPDWLIDSAATNYIGDSDADEEPTPSSPASRPLFRPPVTEEHPPGGPFLDGAPDRFEPTVDPVGPRLGRRDALASLSDPMPAREIAWDVEKDEAPSRPPRPEPSRPAPPPSEPPPKEGSDNFVMAALGAPPKSPASAETPIEDVPETEDDLIRTVSFSHRAVASDERMAVWFGSFLAVVLVVVGFVLFVAAKNDWLLDFERFDQMLGVAFGSDTYEPRAVRTVRVYELDGERLEEPIAAEPDLLAPGLEVRNLAQSIYGTRSDVQLMLVEGDLLNAGLHPHRSVYVTGRLYDGGVEVAHTTVPVGRTLIQEELETITDGEGLDTLHATIAEEAAGLVINPGQQSRFTVVFPRYEGRWDSDAISYAIEVVRAEHSDLDGNWYRLVFEPESGEVPAP